MFTQLAITPLQAATFGVLTVPLTLWIVWTDLAAMRIRNEAVLAMLVVFAVAGAFVLPLDVYLWRYAHFAVMLAVCFVFSITVGMGAGDAKYIAAAAPMVTLPDLQAVAILYAGWSVLLLLGMFAARRSTALRLSAPDWVWFEEDRKGHVPFGLALAPTLTSYFAFGAIG
jgi:prepilin peptidase CpaA